MKTVKACFLSKFQTFGVSDEEIRDFERNHIVPKFVLSPEDYGVLGCAAPSLEAPVVAMLFGRETGFYAEDYNYVKSVAQTGANINFLTFEHCVEQLKDCQALVLPGGAFDSPQHYYEDTADETEFPCLRAKAYALCIRAALQMEIPILGICAGAQTIAAELGMKLCRKNAKTATAGVVEHKTKQHYAHMVNILPNTPLAQMFDNQPKIMVNSRHAETLKGDDCKNGIVIYAVAEDGVPEAWGCAEKHILCVQWHPEDYAVKGDTQMQRIYDWLLKEVKTLSC